MSDAPGAKAERGKKMSKEAKNSVAALVAQLKLLVEKRDEAHALKRRIKGLKRLDARINNLVKRLAVAKAAETETNDNKAKASVDALETSISNIKDALATRDTKQAEYETALFQLRTASICIEKNATIEFIKLVNAGLVSKRNAQEVMPLVWQTGLRIGNIRKRRWARPRRK